MKQTRLKSALSGVLCTVLIAAAALSAAGCSGNDPGTTSPQPPASMTYPSADTPHELGEGDITFPFTVTHLDGTEVNFQISTEQLTVGEALEEVGLISGEEGPYGLMVTTVNGIRLSYEEDKAYWAFYIDGAYATGGVDVTEIAAEQSYMLKAEAA